MLIDKRRLFNFRALAGLSDIASDVAALSLCLAEPSVFFSRPRIFNRIARRFAPPY
jgi:hypothetical protein